jgi:hypothetical protein
MGKECGESLGSAPGTEPRIVGNPPPSRVAKWLQELAEPRPGGEKVRDAVERAAKLAGLAFWRATDIWYSKARQIETWEIDQIADAIKEKNERDARNELRDLKARIARMESLLAQGDAHFHSPSIAHARELVSQLGGPYRPLAGK